ncbi:MAG: hypothetical protein ABEJ31_13350 [Haloarculaceae archaeon]
MASLSTLKRAFAGRERSGDFYECRHCGEAVDESTTECPACGRCEIAAYELE